MKKLLFIAIALSLVTGCMGVMNEHDKDAAVAHSKAQEALIQAFVNLQGKPLCKIEFQENVPVTGVKGFECAAPVSFAGMPQLQQYVQPEHPAKPIAAGIGSAIQQTPMVALGIAGFKAIENAGKGSSSTTMNISGERNSGTIAPTNNVVSGTGNFGSGTSVPTVVEQPAPVIVTPVIVP